MCKLITNTKEESQQVLLVNKRFMELNKSLSQLVGRYVAYTDKHYYNAYNRVIDTDTGTYVDNFFGPVPELLGELMHEIDTDISHANRYDMRFCIKSAIHKIEDLFQDMKQRLRTYYLSDSLGHTKKLILETSPDSRLFWLIQRKINGARRKLLSLSCNSQQFGRTHHA